MAVISFKQLKDIAKNNNETHIIDLGNIDTKLSGIKIPIKVKSFEETLKLKNETRLDREKLTIEYKPFSRLPKPLKELIMKDDTFQNITNNTYIQLVKLDEDKGKLEMMKFRERLFSILIHLDMDYKTEEGKTMWEDASIPNKDYNKLVDLFSEIIQQEIHLELLEVIIDCIRNGNYKEADIQQAIGIYVLRKRLEGLNEEERKEVLNSLINMQSSLEEISNKSVEETKQKTTKKDKKAELEGK